MAAEQGRAPGTEQTQMAALPPGTPNWVSLSTSDIEDARRFYSALFGWTADVMADPAAGGYTHFRKDGKSAAGAGPVMGDGQPVVWTTYIATDDADGVAARVAQAGGTVLADPFDVFNEGRMGVFLDSAGAAFAVWQPMSMPGGEVFNVPGTLSWNELATRDPDGAKAFYGSVFGWEPEDTTTSAVTYTVWHLDGRTIGGMVPMSSDQWPAETPPHWMAYFAVDDADATVARAAELGGEALVSPTDLPQGRFAVLNDPQGATFSIIRLNT